MLDLRPIKYRLATATPGPWSVDVSYFEPRSIWARVGKLFSADDATFADCDLIAHAPTDLAALIAEVEKLREMVGQTSPFEPPPNYEVTVHEGMKVYWPPKHEGEDATMHPGFGGGGRPAESPPSGDEQSSG